MVPFFVGSGTNSLLFNYRIRVPSRLPTWLQYFSYITSRSLLYFAVAFEGRWIAISDKFSLYPVCTGTILQPAIPCCLLSQCEDELIYGRKFFSILQIPPGRYLSAHTFVHVVNSTSRLITNPVIAHMKNAMPICVDWFLYEVIAIIVADFPC